MRFEHFALNVPDVRAHVQWYVEHLGFTISRKRDDFPFTHFLADESGRTFLELYSNTQEKLLTFTGNHPVLFHLAVVAKDARAERTRLEKAGATLAYEDTIPDGSLLIMMRDPWGVPLQLCQRTKAF